MTSAQARTSVFHRIDIERDRQTELLARGKFPWSCDDLNVPDIKKLGVLAEEFGEVAKEAAQIQEQYDREYPGEDIAVIAVSVQRAVHRRRGLLRAELIQVAAVCVAWCEALDRQIAEGETLNTKEKAVMADRTARSRLETTSTLPAGVVQDENGNVYAQSEELAADRAKSCCCVEPSSVPPHKYQDGSDHCSTCGLVIR